MKQRRTGKLTTPSGVMQGNMQFSAESIHPDDPRYPAVLALFQ